MPHHPWGTEISQTKIILYTKYFRKELNATKGRIQHQREMWHCGHDDHSSIDHTIAGITIDLVVLPEQSRSLAKGKMIYLADQFLGVEYDTKNPIVITDKFMSDTDRNHCTARGWITRDTFFRNGATQLLQYIAPTENNGFAQLHAYDPEHTSNKTNDEDMYLNMDYEMHMGRKLDYLFFQSSRLLQVFEIQLLKNQCEQERSKS